MGGDGHGCFSVEVESTPFVLATFMAATTTGPMKVKRPGEIPPARDFENRVEAR
jgi:hypothetical protein